MQHVHTCVSMTVAYFKHVYAIAPYSLTHSFIQKDSIINTKKCVHLNIKMCVSIKLSKYIYDHSCYFYSFLKCSL